MTIVMMYLTLSIIVELVYILKVLLDVLVINSYSLCT